MAPQKPNPQKQGVRGKAGNEIGQRRAADKVAKGQGGGTGGGKQRRKKRPQKGRGKKETRTRTRIRRVFRGLRTITVWREESWEEEAALRRHYRAWADLEAGGEVRDWELTGEDGWREGPGWSDEEDQDLVETDEEEEVWEDEEVEEEVDDDDEGDEDEDEDDYGDGGDTKGGDKGEEGGEGFGGAAAAAVTFEVAVR